MSEDKNTTTNPAEEEVLKENSPEQVCMFEETCPDSERCGLVKADLEEIERIQSSKRKAGADELKKRISDQYEDLVSNLKGFLEAEPVALRPQPRTYKYVLKEEPEEEVAQMIQALGLNLNGTVVRATFEF